MNLGNLFTNTDPYFTPFNENELYEHQGYGFKHKGRRFVHHSTLHRLETAFYTFTFSQKMAIGAIFSIIICALLINWHATLIILFSVMTVLYFVDLLFNAYLIFCSLSKNPLITITPEELAAVPENEWPAYTIFCPLYKEWQVVPQFVKAMSDLDYPADKLQIMFLLEENDLETVDKVRSMSLPKNFEVVIVPHSVPKTKPKAMNYGMRFVKGKYLAIYDAEDVPERLQLKKGVLAFKKSSDKVICIQAKLNFYNPRQNILTRIFTTEYSLWFDLILPGLQSINAPIPLGGTSNHFRFEALSAVQGWDAFNVTEDCDLGMRLAKRGYLTAMMDSTTHEEANSDLKNWYNQRSRWIKGYIQTYFVHMRKPSQFSKNGKKSNVVTFQLIVGSKIFSMFVNPLMWLITIAYFVFRAKYGLFIESLFPGIIFYIGAFSLVFGNFIYIYNYMIGCARRDYDDLIKYVFLVPFYWLGMSAAAWKALYEIIVKPHYWQKTVHGLHIKMAEDGKPLIQGTVYKTT